MEYTVNKLAGISGVSKRTLQYYDEIGLLKPARIRTNNYRVYGAAELDLLQQILIYRELGMDLDSIKRIIYSPGFDREEALNEHLKALLKKKQQIDAIISNVRKTINNLKGVTSMSDNEKFEGLKQKLIDDNEKEYGKEIREKYGDKTVNASNEQLKGMGREAFDEAERLRLEINRLLKEAVAKGSPSCFEAQEACRLHKEWLCAFYPKYNKDYHRALGEMYVADERFKAYYDEVADGCAELLRDAIVIFCSA